VPGSLDRREGRLPPVTGSSKVWPGIFSSDLSARRNSQWRERRLPPATGSPDFSARRIFTRRVFPGWYLWWRLPLTRRLPLVTGSSDFSARRIFTSRGFSGRYLWRRLPLTRRLPPVTGSSDFSVPKRQVPKRQVPRRQFTRDSSQATGHKRQSPSGSSEWFRLVSPHLEGFAPSRGFSDLEGFRSGLDLDSIWAQSVDTAAGYQLWAPTLAGHRLSVWTPSRSGHGTISVWKMFFALSG
jgi:hypothetical protein